MLVVPCLEIDGEAEHLQVVGGLTVSGPDERRYPPSGKLGRFVRMLQSRMQVLGPVRGVGAAFLVECCAKYLEL